MCTWGDGARAQVVVILDDCFGTNGHTFVAEQRGGSAYFIDQQTGEHEVSTYFNDVVSGRTQICRIDNGTIIINNRMLCRRVEND